MVKNTRSTFLVVTPSYNQANFISQTIDSVLSQSGSDIKYVVMDGKSNDDTVKKLRTYGKKIVWRSTKDKGQTDAINKGIRHFQSVKLPLKMADSTYFAYINSDDYYLPGAFSVVDQEFSRHPDKQWLVGDCQIINESNQPIQAAIRLYKSGLRKLNLNWVLKMGNPIPQPAVFIRWSAVQQVGLFNSELRYVMDYEYWLRLLQTVGPPLLVNKPLAAFRIHGASKGGSQFVAQFDEELKVAHRFFPNSAWLFWHSVHNELIKFVYRILK